MSLKSRLVLRGLRGQVAVAVLVFLSAGSLKFWQGWAFLLWSLVLSLGLVTCFYKRDPQTLERRLLTREKIGGQKLIVLFLKLAGVLTLGLSGLDYRFGWSAAWIAPVPWWLTVLALLLMAGCQLLFVPVLQANRFAASVIQVEAGQTVAATGPYRVVRHPMYSVGSVMYLSIPLALGSFVALPAAALVIPILAFRLLNEEKLLKGELPGYAEYCHRTRYRLIPGLW